jgi:hypothetical protein
MFKGLSLLQFMVIMELLFNRKTNYYFLQQYQVKADFVNESIFPLSALWLKKNKMIMFVGQLKL